jgi:GGDEF domain-containing protein
VGIAFMTGEPSLSAEKLLIQADQAMYTAKRAGRSVLAQSSAPVA